MIIPPSNRRYLGFDNPLKTEDKPEYGYEVWVTVNEDEKEDDKVKFKKFEGGLYAVTRAKKSSKSLIETWQKLFRWLETSGYKHGNHQWLEEYITVEGQKGFVAFDLYMPIFRYDKETFHKISHRQKTSADVPTLCAVSRYI